MDRGCLVIDLDATVVVCHSEKESATPTLEMSFGYHPLLEPPRVQWRAGSPGSGCCRGAF